MVKVKIGLVSRDAVCVLIDDIMMFTGCSHRWTHGYERIICDGQRLGVINKHLWFNSALQRKCFKYSFTTAIYQSAICRCRNNTPDSFRSISSGKHNCWRYSWISLEKIEIKPISFCLVTIFIEKISSCLFTRDTTNH